MKCKNFLLLFIVLLLSPCCGESLCKPPLVAVTGLAQAFVGDKRLSKATITVIETEQKTKTDRKGRFQFCIKPGTRITLVLQKKSIVPWHDYVPTQTGTFIVPPQGFIGPYHEITFQVPSQPTLHIFDTILSAERSVYINYAMCNVATTVTGYKKTLKDDPQGEARAKVILYKGGRRYLPRHKPFYFGITHRKTNPFTPKRNWTSQDGGVLIYNLLPSRELYTITAKKPGVKFSKVQFWCRPGSFINLSPPHGPTVLKD